MEDTPQTEQTQPPDFVTLVQKNLDRLNVKPRCLSCNCIGWANFEIFPIPSVTPTLAPNVVMYSTIIVCLRCGFQTQRNLNVLGMPLKIEERRVLTATEITGQQQPMIIQP